MDHSFKKPEYEYQRGDFFILPLDIFDRGLSGNAFAVYGALAYFTDDKGQCFPSRLTLANRCGMSRPVVDKALKELEDKLMIDIEPRFINGKQTTNLYTLFDLTDKRDAMRHLVKYAYSENGEPLDYFEYYWPQKSR